jgi:hypothetical protein
MPVARSRRRSATIIVSSAVLALAFGFSQPVYAQVNSAGGGSGYCWIDEATGQGPGTGPVGWPGGSDHFEARGHSWVRVPCPPPTQTAGLYLGGELIKTSGRVRTTERSAATGAVTNEFDDSGDPIGGGIVAGYNFSPWNNNIVVGPFASFDWLNLTINHNFAGGQFLGTTTNWIINAGVKAGVVTMPGVYLYGLAGAAWLNHDLNINFATAARQNTTTPGFTLGLGGEYKPTSWRLFGNPVSVFAQYQHTWWSTANFNMPASSPAFNYAFKRDDDTFKLGVNVYFSR